jgi:aspartyl-tRNA(Asn)/glutamyl-tRNA(Gln) amidotransferase subunit C
MSTLSQQEVARIASLARLELTAEELTLFTEQLSDILVYVEQIRAVDTAGVRPTSHVLSRPTDRMDRLAPSLSLADALSNAPDAAPEAGLFKVPRVMG